MVNKKEIIVPFREHYAWYFEERYLDPKPQGTTGVRMSFSDVFEQTSLYGDTEDVLSLIHI